MVKDKELPYKERNLIAKDLHTPKYRQRVVPDKKKKESKETARKKVDKDLEV